MRSNLSSGLLHAMRLFVRVVDASSFTAAAAQSRLTVAQVSRTTKELESRLETKLLHRNSRHIVMADAGKRYLEQCKMILELVARAENGEETVVLPVSGPFTGDSPASVFQFAESGAGIALLPPYSIVDAIRSGSLVQVLPQWTTPKVGVYLLLASRLYVPAQIRAWVDLLADTLPGRLRREEAVLADDPNPSLPRSLKTPATNRAVT
jgi:DNA-binding transcriptional LysR family regulator